MKRTTILLAMVLSLMLVGDWQVRAAPVVQQGQGQCLISSPASGSQLRGQVVITGSATHPNFRFYQVGYAPEPNPSGQWKFFSSSETAVTSGRLGVWNTAQIPDGAYQLILEVHRRDGNNEHCFVQKLRVVNTAPTPTFTAEPLPTAASTPTPLPTTQATPTIVIQQPPTATPRATPTFSRVDNPTPTPVSAQFKLPIDTGSIRTASCRGAQITILVAVAIALYFLIRAMIVSGVRKLWKPNDVEGFHSRRPRQN